MTKQRYILVLDESGQRGVRPPADRCRGFIEGGFIVPEHRAADLARSGACLKSLLGLPRGEAKSHEFAAALGPIGDIAAHEHAIAMVAGLFRYHDAVFAGAFLDKTAFLGSDAEGLTRPSKKGGAVMDQRQLFALVAGAFHGFLLRRGAAGVVIHDELSNKAEHDEWRALLSHDPLAGGPIEEVSFVDSRTSELIQLADFVIGFLREHYERATSLRDEALRLVRESERVGLLYQVRL